MKSRRGSPFVGESDADIPSEFRGYVVPQHHADYTPDDHCVWREVLARSETLMATCASSMHPSYLHGMRLLELPDRIPRIEELNERVAPTGWRTVCVDGYVPSSIYVGMMALRIFPVSRQIRRAEHIDFAPSPDMVHDVLGHLPMLFLPEHRDFLEHLARVMTQAKSNALDQEFYEVNTCLADLKMKAALSAVEANELEADVLRINRALVDNASQLTHLRRMYIWSVEFGLIGDTSAFSVYGAGLLSAPSEFRIVCNESPRVLPYSLDVIHYENAFSDPLAQYFVARDFSHLDEVLTAYELQMQRDAEIRTSEIREIVPGARQQRRGHA